MLIIGLGGGGLPLFIHENYPKVIPYFYTIPIIVVIEYKELGQIDLGYSANFACINKCTWHASVFDEQFNYCVQVLNEKLSGQQCYKILS